MSQSPALPESYKSPQESSIAIRCVIVMGVSGCGKSTLAAVLRQHFLALQHAAHIVEGDALHPEANIAKMRAGSALSDADREPWLARVTSEVNSCPPGLCFVACSALKRQYRDFLVDGILGPVLFVHLAAPFDVLHARMRAREHFMPPALLRSQYDDLQPPVPPENFVQVDASCDVVQLSQQVAARILASPG